MFVLFFILMFTLGFITNLSAMLGGPSTFTQDPLERINYRRAFDLTEIQTKFTSLMTEIGCDENVFGQKKIDAEQQTKYIPPKINHNETFANDDVESPLAVSMLIKFPTNDFDTEILMERSINIQNKELYEKECLKKLNKIRRTTLLEPAREAATSLTLMGGTVGGVVSILGTNSYGGSIGIFAVMYNSIWFVRDIVRACYNVYDTPPHDLDELEKEYVIKQCYIPRDLWPIITEKFLTARHNPFEHQSIVNYIKFSLGLTVYAPKPPLKFMNDTINPESVTTLLHSLNQKVDSFFDAYEAFNDMDQIHTLKMNIRKFILSILKQSGETPRYLYLCGSGGIGKTHFAQMLVEWVKEKLPNNIQYESLEINSPEELEGSTIHPGVFLNVLRNQCMDRKRGSIVVMDEASFFNIPEFISASKRVFNGKFTVINTTYFGTGIDGRGIVLDVPPILLLATNNEKINDPALQSRFDVIDFPKPKHESLITYAKKLISLDSLSKKIPDLLTAKKRSARWSSSTEIKSEKIDYDKELEKIIGNIHNFRDVQAAVPVLLSKWYEITCNY